MENSVQFTNACNTVTRLKTKPSDDDLCKLYGLYKQAVFGNNTTSEPTGIFDIKGKRKWTAWNENKGLDKYNAEVKYITLVNELIKKNK
jgi:diazepam-binding inhibitor (GABA receptor modulating acyl-CoA-binding protein)